MTARLYLAGPGVFMPNAAQIRTTLLGLCLDHGCEGLWPGDNDVDADDGVAMVLDQKRLVARAIFNANLQSIKSCDAVVADISPFRGPHCDVGTAFEIGLALAHGKPVFAYSSALAAAPPEMLRLIDRVWCERAPDGQWRDAHGHIVEDFDLADNLMIGCGVRAVVPTPDKAVRLAAEFLGRGAA